MVLEVMGRYAGWLSLESAIAGGADVALIPEIPYDINKVVDKINARRARGKEFTIVVTSEGAMPKDGTITVKKTLDDGKGLDNIRLGGVGEKLANELEKLTGMVARNTVLGYVKEVVHHQRLTEYFLLNMVAKLWNLQCKEYLMF